MWSSSGPTSHRNDDLDVFSNMFPVLGQGTANTEVKSFAGLVEEKARLGPKFSGGKTLFHADHGNLAQTASSLSVASLGTARVAMPVRQVLRVAQLS